MKKLGLLLMPLMAISLLTNCGGGSTPTEDVKFSIQESSVTVKENNTIEIHLDWSPSGDIIEFGAFTFTLKNQSSITSTVTPGTTGDRPLALTISFTSALSTNDKGNLSFDYNDKTTKKEGKGKVENININKAGEKPNFSLTDYTVDYDKGTHNAMVELNWKPASDSITFSNLDFAYGEKHAEEVVAEATTSSPAQVSISFGDTGLTENVTGTLSFAYTDTTTGVTGEDKIENITINVAKPEQVVFTLSSEQQTTVVNKTVTVYVDWTPTDIIKFESFTFTADPVKENTISFDQTGDPRPMPVSITFKDGVNENINGTLSFAYEDTTTGTTGNSSVNVTITKPQLNRWHTYEDWWNYCSNGNDTSEAQPEDVGTVVNVTIYDTVHKVRLIDVDHKNSVYGEPEAHCTFEFANVITNSNGAIQTYWNNKGGDQSKNYDYRESTLNDFLNNDNDCVFNNLPEGLQKAIKEVNKKVGVRNDGGSYTATSYSTKLFPLAHDEMLPHVDYVATNEGMRYKFYENEFEKSKRIKKDADVDYDWEQYYWLRSPTAGGAGISAWVIADTGDPITLEIYSYITTTQVMVAPAFCI